MSTHIAPGSAQDVLATNEIRTDGFAKVSGRTQFTADLAPSGALWAAFVQSPHAHAKVVKIEASAARAVPGVRAILTADDIGRPHFGRMLFDWPVLAYDTVRFVGDRVVAIAAETRSAAQTAAQAVNVEYEELPAALDIARALAGDAPVLHPQPERYTRLAPAPPSPLPSGHPNVYTTLAITKGERDIDTVFANAHRVFEHDFETPRTYPGFIEPRATVVWLEAGVVHIRCPNKTPFLLRRQFARVTGLPEEDIVIEPSAIGGDFGGKGLTPDEYPCYYLAVATGRPVAHVATYTEELRRGATRHQAALKLRTAIDERGRFIAHASTVYYNGGAYAATKPMATLLPGAGYGSVPYNVPNVRIELRGVYTNTLPAAHIRAPATFQTFTAWEQHVDLIARAIGEDPIDFRLKNVIRKGDALFTGEIMHAPMAGAILEKLRNEAVPLPRRDGYGRGISIVCNHTGSGDTSLRMRLSSNGTIAVFTGSVDQGTGAATVVCRVVAATLGIAPDRVSVQRANTAQAAFDAGSGHDRVTHILGRAALDAAQRLRARLELLHEGSIAAVDFDELASRACADGPVEVVGAFKSDHGSHVPGDMGIGGYAIDVFVDKETGQVFIRNALLVTDAGQIINPIAYQGQIDGAFIFGLSAALSEGVTVDEDGVVSALSLADYKMLCMRDIPPLRTVMIPGTTGDGPFGARGIGELFNMGAAAAVLNAVHDAVGVRLRHLPVRAEDIYAALHGDYASVPGGKPAT